MNANSCNEDITCSFSELQELLNEKTDLKIAVFERDLEIQQLKSELESEIFLHKYVKSLYYSILDAEVNQCWN